MVELGEEMKGKLKICRKGYEKDELISYNLQKHTKNCENLQFLRKWIRTLVYVFKV